MQVVAPVTYRVVVVLAVSARLLACFDPSASGLPCGPPACPVGQACVAGHCTSDLPTDASTSGDGAASDATPCPDENDDRQCDVDAASCGDQDRDGVCDVDDTWPCGVLPAPTPADVRVTLMGTLVEIGLNDLVALAPIPSAGPRAFVVGPGTLLRFDAGYRIGDCACPTCLEQIEFGLVPGGQQGCLYSGNPGTCLAPTTGRQAFTVTAPIAPGRYDLRIGLGQDFVCGLGPGWWATQGPAEVATIAHLCVR